MAEMAGGPRQSMFGHQARGTQCGMAGELPESNACAGFGGAVHSQGQLAIDNEKQ